MTELARTHKWRKAPRSLFSTFMCEVCGATSMVKHTGRCSGGSSSAPERFAEPLEPNEVAGMALTLKALVARAGGRIEVTADELEAARELCAHVDATPERMALELVDGPPPDVPRYDASYPRPATP